jgi:hypothetical protein
VLPTRLTQFHVQKGEKEFRLSGLSGSLFSSDCQGPRPVPRHSKKTKMEKVVSVCGNPYLLAIADREGTENSSLVGDSHLREKGIKVAANLIRLSRQQFLCARLYASWQVPLFPTAREATIFFREYVKGDQRELCLARALFAAKTSQRFREEGVVVIGVFLPSRAMHAWTIEGNQMADPYDDIWINYQPVAMLS